MATNRIVHFAALFALAALSVTLTCQSAFKRDPFLGVIGVEEGPPCGAGIWAARLSG